MTTDITTPPAVVEFAKKYHYAHGAKFIREWNGYTVYAPVEFLDENGCYGLPIFILVKDNSIRWNTEEERDEIWYMNNREYREKNKEIEPVDEEELLLKFMDKISD